MPMYPTTNPNNDIQVQPIYNNELANFQTYALDTIDLNGLNLCFGRIVQKHPPPTINEKLQFQTKIQEGFNTQASKHNIINGNPHHDIMQTPSFPERLESRKNDT